MRRFFVSAALAAAVAAPLQAQDAGDPVTSGHGSFFVGPYAGYMVFGDLAESSTGEFSNEDGGFYGAQAGWSFSPNFTLLGNLGYTKSKFTFESDAGPTSNLTGDIGIWLYDANLQFRLPFQQADSWIAPFAQVGAGAIRYTPDVDDLDGEDSQTNVAFNAGIGADFQWMESVGVRLMVKDYITSLQWDDDETIGGDFDDAETQHNWAFTVGVNFGF
jgi:opacity protein-like surface antigen